MSAAPQSHASSHRASPALAEPGDWIEVDGTRGAGARRGAILEVIGAGPHLHFRVRWDETHESLFYPAERGCIVHPPASGAAR